MLLNDWSARDFQRQETAVGLGPAKGKDFATSVGPYLVTPDELAGHFEDGKYNLASVWRINGREKSRSNTNSQHYTFADCIERASANAWIRRGDVMGSGTIGNGCLLEEGSKRERYLQVGDVVELEIEGLGILRNTVGRDEEV
jgi:fumarylacetoacetate (FAA) hydrolase